MSEEPERASVSETASGRSVEGTAISAASPTITMEAPAQKAHFTSARMPSMPFWIAVGLAILVVIVFFFSASALFVFGIGVALSFFLVPVVNWLERHGWNRIVASIVVVGVTIISVLIIIAGIAIVLLDQGARFIENLPVYLDDMGAWYDGLVLPDWLREALDSVVASAQDSIAGVDQAAVVTGLVGSFLDLIGGMFAWFLLPFFLFYLVKDQPRMSATFFARIPAPWAQDCRDMLTISVGNFAKYFKAEFVVGSMMFAIVAIGITLIGVVTDSPLLVQFAILLGVIALVMELIPQIGPILSYIPALILAIPSGVDVVVIVSVFYFIIFNIEGSILVPTFEGKMISFTGATVLVLIAIGFALAGIVGAILALPLASIIRDLFALFFDKAVDESLVVEPVDGDVGGSGGLPPGDQASEEPATV